VGPRAIAAVLSAGAACAGCGPFGDAVEDSFEPLGDAVRRSARASEPFRLSAVTDFDWDRVHALPPYADPESIVRELGVDWDGAGDTESRHNDAYDLLVFVKDGEVVRAFDQQGDGDLTCIDPPVVRGGLTPAEAVLRAGESSADDGSPYYFVSLARPRDAAEARRTEECVEDYS
jgi:hypothetical protein